MNSIISYSGQHFILDSIVNSINNNSGLYVGLMTNKVPSERSYQTNNGITELSSVNCSGYSRALCSGFIKYGTTNPYIQGSGVYFTIASGSWSNVYGYFVTKDTGNSVLWSELFPPDKAGVIPSGEPIIITPIYRQY